MKIKQALDYDQLREVLNAPIEYFRQFGKTVTTPDGLLIYRGTGSKILGVAHLDSVNDYDHFYVNKFGQDDVVFSTHLDDRLGAYILLFLLPAMGINTDILLTEGEEKGKSTAAFFQKGFFENGREYNWMYSFDRRGDDCVHYQYNGTAWTKTLRSAFGTAVHGSNSDIAYLEHLKCCGVNVGTGYYDEHHIMAYAYISETISMVGKFIQFFQKNRKFYFEHKPVTYKYNPPKTNNPPNIPVYVPPSTPALPAPREEVEEVEEIKDDDLGVVNPYRDLYVDIPLDIDEYTAEDGVLQYPEKCAFCLDSLSKNESWVFMGICAKCEMYAVQCSFCRTYICRNDVPTEDMEDEELYFGICTKCRQTLDDHEKEAEQSHDTNLRTSEEIDEQGRRYIRAGAGDERDTGSGRSKTRLPLSTCDCGGYSCLYCSGARRGSCDGLDSPRIC